MQPCALRPAMANAPPSSGFSVLRRPVRSNNGRRNAAVKGRKPGRAGGALYVHAVCDHSLCRCYNDMVKMLHQLNEYFEGRGRDEA